MGDDAEEKAEEPAGEAGGLPIDKASLQQLNMLKQQLEKEIEQLSQNGEGLNLAKQRFAASRDCLGMLTPENEGKSMLVPMSSAVYMDAKISNTKKVLVDVGTGYYVEMPVDNAGKFCASREKMLGESVNKVSIVVKQKRKQLEQVSIVMQQKLYQLQKQQEEQQGSSSA